LGKNNIFGKKLIIFGKNEPFLVKIDDLGKNESFFGKKIVINFDKKY
jgi:hypothetical protein